MSSLADEIKAAKARVTELQRQEKQEAKRIEEVHKIIPDIVRDVVERGNGDTTSVTEVVQEAERRQREAAEQRRERAARAAATRAAKAEAQSEAESHRDSQGEDHEDGSYPSSWSES
ncbi:hypothetical protein [Corynebacterium variabile]|uniref:hypothetical protein n=1 Tax=Corynebacterium variabile TaxID=1727 RepID=UPI0028A17B9B|nr:hypothetical protein [Corynebacterium variabile]